MNILHISTITKNLVLVGQIVDKKMQVQFTHLGCFIEEDGKVITQGRREGRMFILETNEVRTNIFAITKNLVSVGQIVDQRMQARFTHLGCFIEEDGKVIAQGRRERRMFILETNEVGTTMFAKGQKVESDIDL